MRDWRAVQRAKRLANRRFAIHLVSYDTTRGICGRRVKGTVRTTTDINKITCTDCTRMRMMPQSIRSILAEKTRLNKFRQQHPALA